LGASGHPFDELGEPATEILLEVVGSSAPNHLSGAVRSAGPDDDGVVGQFYIDGWFEGLEPQS